MSSLIIERGPVTDSFIDFLTAALTEMDVAIVVGDGEKPPESGWTSGQPGNGDYVAFVTVATNPAPPAAREPQRLSGQHGSWQLGYSLKYFGSSRTQADWCADQVRKAVVAFQTRFLPADFGWSIESVIVPVLGAIARNDQVTPSEWSIGEEVQIRVTRDRV